MQHFVPTSFSYISSATAVVASTMQASGATMRAGMCTSPRLIAPPGAVQRLQHYRRSVMVPAAAAGMGAGPLVDPAAEGRRLVVTPPKLDPSTLEDVRKAEAFGPRGLLLVGMTQEEGQAIRSWFQQMEPGFVVSCCPAALLAGPSTLRQAVEGSSSGSGGAAALPEHAWEQQPADAPPVAFFSGMSGAEQVGVIEGWSEHTGLLAPAFAAVTAGTLDKPLSRLLADIVRAQAQQPPPGYDPETVAEIQARAAAAPASSSGGGAVPAAPAAVQAAAAPGGGSSEGQQAEAESAAGAEAAGAEAEGAAAAGPGGEQVLRSKLQDYVMLNTEGKTETAPMSLDQLKEQIQEKMRQKRAQQAAEERRARKEANLDETDKLRLALQSGKKQGGKGKGKGKGKQTGGSGGSKGFGSS